MQNWMYCLLMFLISIPVQTFFHELVHYVYAKRKGYSARFLPFPNRDNKGKLWPGRTDIDGLVKNEHRLFYILPMPFAFLEALVYAGLAFYCWHPLSMNMLSALIDGFAWFTSNDRREWQEHSVQSPST